MMGTYDGSCKAFRSTSVTVDIQMQIELKKKKLIIKLRFRDRWYSVRNIYI